MQRKGNRHPLVFFNASVIVRVQIGKTALFIKRILLYVKTRGVDMRPQNVQAFRHRLFPDPEHHDGFVHPDRIYFIAAL